jgi:D-alanyl-D-alanine carboxypeptidase/D-alanyl-D-alanine-endopeptidase (penicillin-binding protein 4)
MRAREQGHAARVIGWLPEVLVVLLVLGAAGNAWYDLGHRWFGLSGVGSVAGPPAAPRTALRLPPDGLAAPVAGSSPGGPISAAAVRAALAPYVNAAVLGRHAAVWVSDLRTGKVVYRHGLSAVTPASTMKLLTATAALETLGPMARFQTKVVGTGNRIVLVGGGDPLLASTPARARGQYPARADLASLASSTARALRAGGISRVSLGYDASAFTGPAVDPHWPPGYVSQGVIGPISALWVDEGRDGQGHDVADPAAAAAAALALGLRHAGIAVTGPVTARRAPATATQLAVVDSAPLGEIVQNTLAVSDNNAAEVILRQVGAKVSGNASFAGGVAAVRTVLSGLGAVVTGSTQYDGSGLSRENRVTPQLLLDVLGLATSPAHPELREVLSGLPVAGFTGSLQFRFDKGPAAARGRVRAKTGTLTGVHALAGVASDVHGNLMLFVMIADRVPGPDEFLAQHDLGLMAGALGACTCGPAS